MNRIDIVIDCNVIVSGLRSSAGMSFQLLQLIGSDTFTMHLSVPLLMEYEEVLQRQLPHLMVDSDDVEKLLGYYVTVGSLHEIFYLWRPVLRDPDDEMVLELAVKCNAAYIVTFNKRDFRGVDQFGIELVTPAEFLTILGVLK